MEFSYNGIVILLKKDLNENNDMFIKRGNFIIKNIKSINNFNELVTLSYIYIYYTFYNCIYNKDLLDKIKNLQY